MKLNELMQGVEILETNVDMEQEISGVVYDSREAAPGCLFVAITGFAADGNRFIPMALEKGAVAVVTGKKPETNIPYVLVGSDRLALAAIGCQYYGHPAETMTMIGITGTNGKTSATVLLKHVLERVLGAKVGLIGTMENRIGEEVVPTERTTPESFALQGLFARMRDAGCTHVVMEVSSHALSLHRVAGIRYDVGAFTNLTEDHLDFHKTMDSYCDAKATLFSQCRKGVVNGDDAYCGRILAQAGCPVLTTGFSAEAGLRGTEISLLADGVSFTAEADGTSAPVCLPIPGRFTVYNALTVLGICLQLGLRLSDCAGALASARGVKGRVEVVPTPGKEYTVLVDYAHTPDGLKNVLEAVRGFCRGRVICVFGCGGDRDPIKRPIMGKIATELADYTVITSDNPRCEEPMAIIGHILEGVSREKNTWEVIENRVQAIHRAMDIGKKDDIIVLAGKGHETYQEICHVKYPLDEREVVAAYL